MIMKAEREMTQLFIFVVILALPVRGLTGDTCDATGCPGDDQELIANFRKGCPPSWNDVQCAWRKAGEIERWLSRNNNFNILMTGKMGTGKSTLIKGLAGETYDPETDDLLPHTVEVIPYKHEQNKINFTMFDTPGLNDNPEGSNDHSYLSDMFKNTKVPDLLIFAIRMDDANFRGDDLASINNVSAAFGWTVWENAIVILTFANKVRLEGHEYDDKENKVYFSKAVLDFDLKITKILRECKVQKDVYNQIPVIPVGLVKQPHIPSDSSGKSWIDNFWNTVHARLKASRQEKTENSQTCPPCPPCEAPKAPERKKTLFERLFI